jgi:glycosyl hydrolase family 18 (putative chitinase)
MVNRRLRVAIASAAVIGCTVLGATSATAATPLPAHVFAPYFEAWTTDSIATLAQQSGDRYLTLAFLETLSKTSCTLAWNGSASQTVASIPHPFLADITTLRSGGGDVIPSFGGWSADQGGTEIGDSCKDPALIAAAYEQVVTTYEVSRLDMDIEGRSLTKSDGIDRRNKAIKLLQDWAAGIGWPLTISYTLPTSANGLEASGKAVLANAKANGVTGYIVQPMVFDYYDRVTRDMGAAAESALIGTQAYFKNTLEPGQSDAALWARMGATIMNGIDDYPKKTEVTTIADAQRLLTFAQGKHMAVLSMWAIQRDNGNCPGVGGANDCSGIAQPQWGFSQVFAPFTGP